MLIIKALLRRLYWVIQKFFGVFGISILFLDPINFRILRISKLTPETSLFNFLVKFRPIDNGIKLIRVGDKGDGGYLIPDDIRQIKFCFSAGCDKHWSFEKDLEKLYGIKSFIIDSEDKKPVDLGVNQFFTPSWLGIDSNAKTLKFEDWIEKSGVVNDSNLLLQMDIEGFEWECINGISLETLSKFTVIIVEFHSIRNILNYRMFLEVYSPVINKLTKNFDVVHFHPNNCCGSHNFKGAFSFPNVFEVTFHRKDRAIGNFGFRNLPHNLDVKNVLINKDVTISFP